MTQFFKDIALFFYWYPFRMIMYILPYWLIYLIGVCAGSLLYILSRGKKTLMAAEFSLIFPERNIAEINQIVRKSFVNFCLSEIEVLLYPRLNKRNINKTVTIEGAEHLDEALSRGKGVLLFQAHLGAFQMVMPAIGYNGYTMNQISAPASVWKEKGFSGIKKAGYDIKARYESTLPIKHLAVSSSMRPVYRALSMNEIVGITSDGGGGKRVVKVDFLGRVAHFQEGGAILSERTGAEIIPAFILTGRWLKHRLILHEKIGVPKAGGDSVSGDSRQVIQRYAALVEDYVRQFPDHYGFTLFLRKSRATIDPYPFFLDHWEKRDRVHTDA